MSTKNNKIKIKSTRKRRNRSQRRRKNRKAYTIRGGSCFNCFGRTRTPTPPPPPASSSHVMDVMDPTDGYMKIILDPTASQDARNEAARALNEYLTKQTQHIADAAGVHATVIDAIANLGAPGSSHIKPRTRRTRPLRPLPPVATE